MSPPTGPTTAGGGVLLTFILVSVVSFATSGVRVLRWASLGLLLALALGPFAACLLLVGAAFNGEQMGWLGSMGFCLMAGLAGSVGSFFWYLFRFFRDRPWDPDAPVAGRILAAGWALYVKLILRRPRG